MLSRRDFLRQSSQLTASLTLSATLFSSTKIAAQNETAAQNVNDEFAPNIYLKITPDNRIDFWVKKAEMGQQVHTALAQIAVDELGASLTQVNIIQAKTEDKFQSIFTGASWSIAGSWLPLRKLMAKARVMLIQSACQVWQCEQKDCEAKNSFILHRPSGRQLSFGELAPIAARLPEPTSVELKPKGQFRLIGKNIARLDNHKIVTGQTQFSGDFNLPGMRFVTMIHPPLATCLVKSLDAAEARKMNGVINIIEFKDRIAIVANNQWTALKAKEKLKVGWDFGDSQNISDSQNLSDTILTQQLDDALALPGVNARQESPQEIKPSEADINAEYYLPFAAHAPMETPTAIVQLTPDSVDIWAPTQTASDCQQKVATLLNRDKSQVTIHTTLIGGSFGRKLENDYILEAVEVAKIAKAPIKLLWTRESDIQNGFFRPYGKIQARAVSQSGSPHKIQIKAASPSLFSKTDPDQIKDGHDWAAVMGLRGFPYAVDHLNLTHQVVDVPEIPVVAWRGTFSNHNCLAVECLIDELAHHDKQDPLQYRLKLLRKDTVVSHFPGELLTISQKRLKRVLNKAASMLDWQKRKKNNTGHGIACFCYDTNAYAAHAIEVKVSEQNELYIKRVTCAFDIGLAVNPDGIKAQLEGSIIFGLSSALHNKISFSEGHVVESNFHDQPVLRLNQTPEISIHIFADGDTPGGAGECGLPSVTPALLNAIYDACGKRLRSLPIRL